MSVPATYFDEVYERSADPWRLATEWYEKRKYLMTVASLPRERYRRGFEPACSVGVLTEMLAERCEIWSRRTRLWPRSRRQANG